MSTRRVGITLVETLVVIGIIGVLVAILIPAVQYARETARKTTCANNIRQLVVAIEDHESAHSTLPSLYNGTFLQQPRNAYDEFFFYSWRTAILPQLEQTALYECIDQSVPATDEANQTYLNTPVATFVCPSTSNPNAIVPINAFNDGEASTEQGGTAARSDYEAIGGVLFLAGVGTLEFLENVKFGAWGEPRSYAMNQKSILYRKARLRDISDGLSNTMLIGERAGRPDLYRRGMPEEPYPGSDPSKVMDSHQAAWGISTHFPWLVLWHEQSINESNRGGIYSFHPSGANVGLADGSVRFLSVDINQGVLNALGTRSAGD